MSQEFFELSMMEMGEVPRNPAQERSDREHDQDADGMGRQPELPLNSNVNRKVRIGECSANPFRKAFPGNSVALAEKKRRI